MYKFSNNAKSLLAAAISDSDLTFSVTGGEGTLFPSSGDFMLTLTKANGTREIVWVESRSTDSFTIKTAGRGQEGTSAQTYSAGDVTAGVEVALRVTKGVLESFVQMINHTFQVVLNCSGLSEARTLVVPNKAGTLALLDDITSSLQFTTGDVKVTLKTTADTGWVMMNDGTIGDASSGASTRANADTEALFTLLWNNTDNANCAVSTGRGANAAADFAAHKTIALPKALGRALGIAGAGSGLTSRALAVVAGAETHDLQESEIPGHTHTGPSHTHSTPNHTHTVTDPGHTHSLPNLYSQNGGSTQITTTNAVVSIATETGESTTGISIPSSGGGTTGSGGTGATGSTGGGNAHNNMQPTTFLNIMIKL